jgi:hypothetical protein
MKTSNKLLLALFTVVLLFALGLNFPLKRTFDSIGLNDPYLGYLRDTLPPFKYIKLTGNRFTLIQVQPGTQFELRRKHLDFERNLEGANLKTEVRSDTLFVLFGKIQT